MEFLVGTLATSIDRLCRALRLMVKDQKLVELERKLRVHLSFIVRELNLIGTIEKFHDGPHLSANEAMRGYIREKRDDVQQTWYGVHGFYFTKQLVNRGIHSPRRTIHMLRTTPEPPGPRISNSIT
jgi:hypothetical protein